MSFKFGQNSREKLESCHPKLQRVMNLAISRSYVDFGISEGYRTLARQYELFKKGLSRIDGINRVGKHNHNPSLAVDIYAWVDGKAMWDDAHLGYLAGVILQCGKELGIKLRWGGDWDRDGIIAIDHKLKDLPHYELI